MATRVDLRATLKLADDIGKLGGDQLGAAVVRALNEGGESAYDLSRKTILRGINLTERYVGARMQTRAATKNRPLFEIVAPGGKGFQTNLSHYGAMLDPATVNWTNDRISAMGKKFGKWPGWTYRKGDEARGIAENEKQYTASVTVVKGARKSAGKKFTLPGKNDSEGNPLLFRRVGGTVESVSGPSVYQLFRSTIPLVADQIQDDLEVVLAREAEREFQRAIS